MGWITKKQASIITGLAMGSLPRFARTGKLKAEKRPGKGCATKFGEYWFDEDDCRSKVGTFKLAFGARGKGIRSKRKFEAPEFDIPDGDPETVYEDEWITTREAAKILGRAVSSMWNEQVISKIRSRCGTIPGSTMKRRLLLKEDVLAEAARRGLPVSQKTAEPAKASLDSSVVFPLHKTQLEEIKLAAAAEGTTPSAYASHAIDQALFASRAKHNHGKPFKLAPPPPPEPPEPPKPVAVAVAAPKKLKIVPEGSKTSQEDLDAKIERCVAGTVSKSMGQLIDLFRHEMSAKFEKLEAIAENVFDRKLDGLTAPSSKPANNSGDKPAAPVHGVHPESKEKT